MGSKSQDIINFIKNHKILAIVLCLLCPPLILIGLVVYGISKLSSNGLNAHQANKQKTSTTQNKATKNISSFIKSNKKIYFIVLAIIVVIVAIALIIKAIKTSAEENKDYYISVDDSFAFDCNAKYDDVSKVIRCENQTISGAFSNFDNVELDYADKVNGETFSDEISYFISKSDYEKDDFDIKKLGDQIESSTTFYIWNTYLKKNVYEKRIKIYYRLSDADKTLIAQKHNDWKAWKEAEDAKKVEQEASAQAEAEAQQNQPTSSERNSNLSDSAVEQECQDAKYYVQSSYYKNNIKDIISISDYNFGVFQDAYDKDSNRILMVRWNGKDKSKNKITFVCYISGPDESHMTVHWISGNDNDIWKSETDLLYNTYNADGNKLQ